MTNPTLVIVHGASHTGEHFVPLANALQAAGFTNVYNLTLPSAGSKPAVTSFDPDAAHIRDTVTKCVDNGEDVAVIMHSYGGAPSCEAVRGLSKEDRAKEGKTGGWFISSYVSLKVKFPLNKKNMALLIAVYGFTFFDARIGEIQNS